MAFPDGWGYKWPIAINADSVISSPVADWPCLVTDAHFPAGAWAQMQATGADLRFSLDEAGATELYYDAPRLSVSGMSAHLYVAVPSLASGADTTIYGWVGNATATAPSAAWMQNTYAAPRAGEWPVEEGSGATAADRTSNGYDATIYGATWSGNTLLFDNLLHRVTTAAAVPYSAAFTVAVRIKRASTAQQTYRGIAAKHPGGEVASDWFLHISADHKLHVDIPWVKADAYLGSRTINDTNWHSVVLTRSGSAGAWTYTGYIDGTLDRAVAATHNPVAEPTVFTIGNINDATNKGFWGYIDCVSYINSGVWGVDEVALHHLMLSSPATFATAGELVAVGGSRYPAAHRTHVWRNGPITYIGGT